MAGSKSPRARLLHIRDEIDGVAMIVRNLSFAQYQGSYLHRRAVERAVQIVSEAAKALSPDYLAKYPNAPWTSHCRDRQYLAARVPAPRRQAALGNSDRSPAQIAADRDANAGGTRQITRCVRLQPLRLISSVCRSADPCNADSRTASLTLTALLIRRRLLAFLRFETPNNISRPIPGQHLGGVGLLAAFELLDLLGAAFLIDQ